jgi:hypothetical protein
MEGVPKHNELPFDPTLGKLETVFIPHTDEEVPDSMLLRQFGTLEGKVVREEILPSECEGDIECVANMYAQSKESFDELRAYGFDVVNYDSVVAKNEDGEVKVFTIVDRIEGELLDYLDEQNTDEMAKQTIQAFCQKVAEYYSSKRALHWNDFGLHQIMYGTKAGEKEEKCWIIDIGPGYFNQKDTLIQRLVREDIELLQKRIPSINLHKAIDLLK